MLVDRHCAGQQENEDDCSLVGERSVKEILSTAYDICTRCCGREGEGATASWFL